MTLESRKRQILRAIVTEYVDSAEPVGSEWLVSRYDFGCRSATLRNEMAEMSEQGYLVQKHTSGGRIPSDLGYRYYVDWLMSPCVDEVADAEEDDPVTQDLAEIVRQTCRLLSHVTQYPSVASTPAISTNSLRRVYLPAANQRRALLVLLFSAGQVEHCLLDLPGAVDEGQLSRVANYINATLARREVRDLERGTLGDVPEAIEPDRALITSVHEAIVHVARSLTDSHVFFEGASHMLRQPEFHDVLLLEQVLSALEEQSVLYQVFSQVVMDQTVTVLIGTENPVEAMQSCTVVGSQYTIGTRTSGFIGVVGPTRMHYDRTIALVGALARDLSLVLTHASLS